MKRLFTSIMLLALLAGTQTWAVEYDLWVAGVRVTDANKADIKPSRLTRGKISFNGSTLYFADVKLYSPNDVCIENKLSGGLTVTFQGENDLSTWGRSAIYSTSQLTLNGGSWDNPASLKLVCHSYEDEDEDKDWACIFLDCSERLNIWNLYLDVYSYGKYAIRGSSGAISTSCSELWVRNGNESAIQGFSSWSMSDKGKLAWGYTYDRTSKCVRTAEGDVATDCRFFNGLYVGKAMPRIDRDTMTPSPEGISAGTVTWTKADNTLELNGVTFDAEESFVQNYNVPGLNIKLTGKNTITAQKSKRAFYAEANTTFSGDGSLEAKGAVGLSASKATVTICVGNTVSFDGEWSSYFGGDDLGGEDSYSELVLKRVNGWSDYCFKSEDSYFSCISHCSRLVLEDMDFYYGGGSGTQGCYFNEQTHRVEMTGGAVASCTEVNIYGINKRFPVYVCGKQLNNCNQNGGLGSPYIKKGIVKYKDNTNTLELDSVVMDIPNAVDDVVGIKTTFEADKLVIDCNGYDVKLNAAANVLDLSCNTTITGLSATLTSTKESAISTRGGASVTISTFYPFEAKGKKYGYYGSGTSEEKLTLNKVNDYASYSFSGNEAGIYNVRNIVHDGLDYTTGGCYFDSGSVFTNGGDYAKTVGFGAIKEKLPIYVCGKQLNRTGDENEVIYVGSKYITGGGLTAICYQPSTKALFLIDAVVNYATDSYSNDGVIMTADGTTLEIEVHGDNVLSAPNAYSGMWFRGSDVGISGNGTLNLSGKWDDLYAMGGSMLTIGGDVTLLATNKGIGSNNKAKKITVTDNAVVKAKQISNVEELALMNGRCIVKPNGAAFSASDCAIMLNGSLAKDVVIDRPYDLNIAGTQVNAYNCGDILGNGVFSYDNDTKTLTISGDYTSPETNVSVIRSFIEDLTIDVASNVTIVSNASNYLSIFSLHKPTTITGGLLTLECPSSSKETIGIYLSEGTLTFDEAQVTLVGDFSYGITGQPSADLVIQYSDITATAHTYGAIADWNSITLTGCDVIEPYPSQILPNGIADADGNIVGYGSKGTVIISTDPDAIDGVNASGTAVAEVYDLAGRRLDQTRSGINIVRNKDGKAVKVLRK